MKATKKQAAEVKKSGQGISKTGHIKNLGVGKLARALILEGKTFQETFESIKKAIPETKFSKKCYYWYRYHLKVDDNKNVPVLKRENGKPKKTKKSQKSAKTKPAVKKASKKQAEKPAEKVSLEHLGTAGVVKI